MENWDKKCIDLLKFTPLVDNNNDYSNLTPWKNINPTDIDHPSKNYHLDSDLCISKIRIVFKGNYDQLAQFIDCSFHFNQSQYLIIKPIKLLVLFEQHIFDGSKIYFDQLQKRWIIPINLSLFLKKKYFLFNQQTDKLFVFNQNSNIFDNDYYFQVQCYSDNNIPSNDSIYYSDNLKHINSISCSVRTIIINFFVKALFLVVWESTSNKLLSYTFNQDEGKKIYSHDLKRVKILDKQAIIIPIGTSSFKTLKYALKSINFDLLDNLYIFECGSIIDLKYEKEEEEEKEGIEEDISRIDLIYFNNNSF